MEIIEHVWTYSIDPETVCYLDCELRSGLPVGPDPTPNPVDAVTTVPTVIRRGSRGRRDYRAHRDTP